jgi:predicted metal-dependent hydrolase
MEGGLEVVIPMGFDRQNIPDILQRKRAWIKRATKRIAERRQLIDAEPALPVQISLLAIGETWSVEPRPTASKRVTAIEKTDCQLILSGAVDDVDLCQTALRKWTACQAKQHLAPWLQQISETEKLPFEKVTIRGQKTRWGSCSARKSISLNYKLLFLPPDLVRYVLVHELCHTKHLNHSAKFWALLDQKYPDYRQARVELRASWRYLPGWLQD